MGLPITGLALLLPWLTWLPVGPWSGSVVQAPARVMLIAPIVLAALWLATRGARWLGLFVAYVGLQLWLQPGGFWLAHEAHWIVWGALALIFVRDLSEDWRGVIAALLAWSGIAESLYITLTAFGVNPLGIYQGNTAAGTLGHSTYAGAYLAITAPLVPRLGLLALFVPGVIASHSLLGAIGLAIGVAVRCRTLQNPALWLMSAGVGVALIWRGGTAATRLLWGEWPALDSLMTRLGLWKLMFVDWLGAPWMGWGFGAFTERVVGLQMKAQAKPGQTIVFQGDIFDVAHNDLAQLVYCGGLVALAILIGFLWAHRALWRTRYAGAVAALAVVSLGTFPWRMPAVVATAVVTLGLAIGAAEPA